MCEYMCSIHDWIEYIWLSSNFITLQRCIFIPGGLYKYKIQSDAPKLQQPDDIDDGPCNTSH